MAEGIVLPSEIQYIKDLIEFNLKGRPIKMKRGDTLLVNISTIKKYNRESAFHRIAFNLPMVHVLCTLCNRGRPPLPYGIFDLDNKPYCLNCAKTNNFPIASAFETYQNSFNIPSGRIWPDENYPYTGMLYFGIPVGFKFNVEHIEWFARSIASTAAHYSTDVIYCFFDNGTIKPLVQVGIIETAAGAKELLENAEKSIHLQVEDAKPMLIKNKVQFFTCFPYRWKQRKSLLIKPG